MRAVVTNMFYLAIAFAGRARALRKVLHGQALYDQLYQKGYHSNLQLTHSTFLVYELLDQRNFPNYAIHTVLDVGCSHGKAVQQLWESGKNASGVDVSSVAIDLAKKSRLLKAAKHGVTPRCVIGTPCFQQASVTSLPFSNRSFDAVISTDVLEHVAPQEVQPAVNELARITRSLLFLKIAIRPSTEGPDSELHQLKRIGMPVPENLHLTQQGASFWLAEFERVGFYIHHRACNVFELVLRSNV
jgi:SAM-dependent methyltransferase